MNADKFMVALCLWREARSEGEAGMIAVGHCILNRAARRKTSAFTEVTRPWAFSSITAHGDRQLNIWPKENDASWITAQRIASDLFSKDKPADPTKGSTLYYDDSISFPATWNRKVVTATVKIGRLNFFKEV
jgi:spore germination cell wall hydrolase CwlJ-like protein